MNLIFKIHNNETNTDLKERNLYNEVVGLLPSLEDYITLHTLTKKRAMPYSITRKQIK